MDQKGVVFQISGTVNPVNMDTEGAIKVFVLTGFPLSLPQRGGEAGEKEKESARPSYPAHFLFFLQGYPAGASAEERGVSVLSELNLEEM